MRLLTFHRTVERVEVAGEAAGERGKAQETEEDEATRRRRKQWKKEQKRMSAAAVAEPSAGPVASPTPAAAAVTTSQLVGRDIEESRSRLSTGLSGVSGEGSEQLQDDPNEEVF